jgi:photosystem II stability/assembly factor-like uncharacterized protein
MKGLWLRIALPLCISLGLVVLTFHFASAWSEQTIGATDATLTTDWKNLGFYGRAGSFFGNLVLDHNRQSLYQCGDGVYGIYKSTDWAENWFPLTTTLNQNGTCQSIDEDLVNGILYQANYINLLRSDDGGYTWRKVYTSTSSTTHGVQVVVVDPTNPTNLYVGLATGAILKSTDSGKTWKQASLSLNGSNWQTNIHTTISSIAVDPTNPQIVYFGAGMDYNPYTVTRGIYKSIDGGHTFVQIVQESDLPGTSSGVGVNAKGTLFAGYNNNTWRSRDKGQTWDLLNITGNGNYDAGGNIGFNPIYTDTVWVWGFESDDEGDTWHWIGPLEPPVVDPLVPDLAFAGTPYGVSKSTDGGQTWENSSNGIAEQTVRTVAIDPRDNRRIFVMGNGGMGFTDDGGNTWKFPVLEDIGGDITFDPNNPQTMYVMRTDWVFKSIDGGQTWQQSNDVVTNPPVEANGQELVIDDNNSNHMFLSVSQSGGSDADPETKFGGVYTSVDGGMDWEPTGLSQTPIWPLLYISDTHSLFAGATNTWTNNTLGGIYRSLDDGVNWTRVALTGTTVTELVRDSYTTPHIYAVARNPLTGGVYKSEDGGDSWTKITPESMVGCKDLEIDPENPDHLYVILNSDIYYSGDAGRNWSLYQKHDLTEGEVRNVTVVWNTPQPIQNFAATSPTPGKVKLSWEYPNDPNITGIEIRVMTDTFPTRYYEGQLVTKLARTTELTGTYIQNVNLSGNILYYSAFAIDKNQHYSYPVSTKVSVGNRVILAGKQPAQKAASTAQKSILFVGTNRGLFQESVEPFYKLFLPFIEASENP